MNPELLRQSLMRAARGTPPSDAVPPGFAHRVRAAIRAAEADPVVAWASGLWRAAVCSLGVAAVAGVLLGPLHVGPHDPGEGAEPDLADAVLSDISDLDPGTPW